MMKKAAITPVRTDRPETRTPAGILMVSFTVRYRYYQKHEDDQLKIARYKWISGTKQLFDEKNFIRQRNLWLKTLILNKTSPNSLLIFWSMLWTTGTQEGTVEFHSPDSRQVMKGEEER